MSLIVMPAGIWHSGGLGAALTALPAAHVLLIPSEPYPPSLSRLFIIVLNNVGCVHLLFIVAHWLIGVLPPEVY